MYGYVYETTFLNHPNWVYYGQHKSDVYDENYFGSGTVVTNYVQKYGRDSVNTRVLCWCETKGELNEKEKEIIKTGRMNESLYCVNIADGGDGGSITDDFSWYTDGTIDIYLRNSEKIPSGFYRGRCRLKNNSNSKGKVYINSGQVSKQINTDELQSYIDPGWKRGIVDRGESWRENVRKSAKSRQFTEDGKKRKLESLNRRLDELRQQNDGKCYWGNNGKGHAAHNKGKISITDGTKNRYITIDQEIPDGWRIGNTQNKKDKKKNV